MALTRLRLAGVCFLLVNIPVCFRLLTWLREHRGGSLSPNPHYQVRFDGHLANIFENRPQRGEETKGVFVEGQSNNLASVTMHRQAAGGRYTPVKVEVTSHHWQPHLGTSWHIRPYHLVISGVVTEIDESRMHNGVLSFLVLKPCQMSVEIGDDMKLFPTKDSYRQFANLIVAANPPLEEWPHQKPSLQGVEAGWACESSEAGRTCLIGTADGSCDSDLVVPPNQDLYFTAVQGSHFKWGDGCGAKPKTIVLQEAARVFLDEGVVVYARVESAAAGVGIYGYGTLSNVHMDGKKDPKVALGLVHFSGSGADVFGVTLAASTYRNIMGGDHCKVAWTKSFAWVTETDCVSLGGPGGSVTNNFFRNNDDCLKMFWPNTTFDGNVIWHQHVGRPLLMSWGNLGENRFDLDAHVQVRNTSIIHDEDSFNELDPQREALPLQADMIYYSSLVNAQHSPRNMLGRPDSPVLIENLHLEGRVGSILILTNGYKGLAGKAPWMGSNGCTGDIHLRLKGLDLSQVTHVAAPSVVGGCNIGDKNPEIINGNCLCQPAMQCETGRRCSVELQLEDVKEAPAPIPRFADNLVVGHNAVVRNLDAARDALFFQ